MKMPRFTAEASLYITTNFDHTHSAVHHPTDTISPAVINQNCFNACYNNCNQGCGGRAGEARSACLKECKRTERECRTACTQSGNGGQVPGDGSTGGCSPLLPSGSGLPIYGNYCGPGFGDPTGLTPPVDAVDAVCQAHDRCYAGSNMFNCGCDRALITSMPAAIIASPCLSGKVAGAAAMTYFANAPCVCSSRVCLPFVGCNTTFVPGRGGIGIC
jgi:hypothetical protein